MAINDPNYRYAIHTWETDGVETDYEISFDGGYIRQSDVVAFSVVVDPDTDLTSDRTIHPVTFLSEDGESATVRITPAVAAGRRLVIFRSTAKDRPLVEFQAGSVLTKENLDLANKQAVFGIAEIMDALNGQAISVGGAVQQIIDINALVQSIYEDVLTLLATGGIVSVQPRVWTFTFTGTPNEDFPLAGADVEHTGFYDTYVAGQGKEPTTDYTIIIPEIDGVPSPADTSIRFVGTYPAGTKGFTVLRGYARPYTGPTPLTTLRVPVINVPVTSYFIDKASEFALLRATNAAASTFTVKVIPEGGDPTLNVGKGSYCSIMQTTAGQVTIAADVGVTLRVPAGYLPKTRVQNSVVSVTCGDDAGNSWVLSGDLAVDMTYMESGSLLRFNKRLAVAHSNSTVTGTTPAGFTANVQAGKYYRIRAQGTYQTAATTTGCTIGLLGAGGVTGTIQGRASGAITNAAANTDLSVALTTLSGAGSTLTTTGVAVINTPHFVELDAVFACTANGTLALTFASEVGSSAAQLNPGFSYTVEEVEITP